MFIALPVATCLSCDYRFTCCHTSLECLPLYLLPQAFRVLFVLHVPMRLSCVYRFICSHTPLVCLSLYLFPHASRVFIILFPHASRVFIILFPRASRVFIAILVVTRLSVCLSLYLFPRASHRWAEGTRARRTRKQSIADIPRDRYNLYSRQQQQVKKQKNKKSTPKKHRATPAPRGNAYDKPLLLPSPHTHTHTHTHTTEERERIWFIKNAMDP